MVSLETVLDRYWGYASFRPLQREAMEAILANRDSLVVLPTGGGKSLCFQAPALVRDGLAIVVSPLISLMKDQVDTLVSSGVPAACYNSAMASAQKAEVARGVGEGRYRLLYVAPERLVGDGRDGFLSLIGQRTVSFVAIDEAHCISQWGHDFRPEYRQLARLRDQWPAVALHAFTATATARVRRDIVSQLGLRDAVELVGSFDRPNLVYRVLPRSDLRRQLLAILQRRRDQAGIIYCQSRKEVDTLAAWLEEGGYRSKPYHAGLSDDERHRNQDAFLNEDIDIVVATVAFGMGIDRSNVRFVIHAGAPQSLEHYQQESGRAGRDGLEAECVLISSAADFLKWRMMLERNGELTDARRGLMRDMERYAASVGCRHRRLMAYFGETSRDDDSTPPHTNRVAGTPASTPRHTNRAAGTPDSTPPRTNRAAGTPASTPPHTNRAAGTPDCGACDFCLGELEPVAEPDVLARKILSCVARVGQRFGAGHVTTVLRGQATEAVTSRRHHELSTFGLLAQASVDEVRGYIDQLIAHGLLQTTDDQYPVLQLTADGVALLKDPSTQPDLSLARQKQPERGRSPKRSRAEVESWDGVDRDAFERLRAMRLDVARSRGVPPYVIFHDTTLRELARRKPASVDELRHVYGVGARKAEDLGELVLATLRQI